VEVYRLVVNATGAIGAVIHISARRKKMRKETNIKNASETDTTDASTFTYALKCGLV
jgi:hypothetical protein